MKKFQFRLQALLRQREQIEKDRQKDLAAAVRQVQEQRAKVDDIANLNRRTVDRKRAKQTGAISVGEMQLFSRFLHRIKRETLGAEELLRAFRKTEVKKREALLEAAKNRKIYETLKEHQKDRYYREAEQMAVKEADEVGLTTFRAHQFKPDK